MQENAHSIQSLKEWLAGSWTLQRAVNENNSPGKPLIIMNGTAEWVPVRDGLLYQEKGILLTEGYEGPFYKSYLFHFPCPSEAEVYFPDGRLFYRLNLIQGKAEVTHGCGLDIYQGMFQVLDNQQLHTCWQVLGPKKKMKIKTVLIKESR